MDFFKQGKLPKFVIASPVVTGRSNPESHKKNWIASRAAAHHNDALEELSGAKLKRIKKGL